MKKYLLFCLVIVFFNLIVLVFAFGLQMQAINHYVVNRPLVVADK